MVLIQESVHFFLCHKQSNKIEGVVLNRVGFLGFFFVLNRVRLSNPQRLIYAQILVEYPSPRATRSNSDLQRFKDWCSENQLLFNPDKIKLLPFGSSQMSAKVHKFHVSLVGKRLKRLPSPFWTVT